ncbi:hypothetical protein A5765_02545 [Mycolicibacterium celeriflavum]|uniref:septation protein SepH n=1 Tax=Mycolicibacterium celeriflavum TaxID=1249101 RepID=UPI0007FF6CA3|nr:septation protein SepH [Mycolicibacterium celeriflavum]OBG19140.1 hypothetical protein A5765_02545 [Mycolicibacterium celeriflavum]
MRELKVVGLDVDGKRIICEAADSGDKFILRPDERLRAAIRGEQVGSSQTRDETEVQNVLRPKEIQSRIRAGASVAQVAEASGADVARVERFAHPVLLERSRAAELATAAHPVLPDGPSVLTLLETVTTALIARGLDPDSPTWDAWRNEDGRWTVQLAWKAGMSDNVAHFRYTPGAHGGTVTAFDDAASELIDPNFARPLRPVAALREPEVRVEEPTLPIDPPLQAREPEAVPEAVAPQQPKARRGKAKPAVPAWEDVLLGVRSGGQR